MVIIFILTVLVVIISFYTIKISITSFKDNKKYSALFLLSILMLMYISAYYGFKKITYKTETSKITVKDYFKMGDSLYITDYKDNKITLNKNFSPCDIEDSMFTKNLYIKYNKNIFNKVINIELHYK
jgi:hypothetical protein